MESIISFFKDIFPYLSVVLIVGLLVRFFYLVKTHKKLYLHREMIYVISLIYILILFELVTLTGASWTTSNFVLFNEINRYEIWSGLFFINVIGNVVLFLPFGFLASYYLKIKKIFFIFSISFLFSLSIELFQILIGRVFDVDDIFLNVIGGMIGYLMYLVVDKWYKNKNAWKNKAFCYN